MPQDRVRALMWLTLAALNADAVVVTDAEADRDRLVRRMTEAEVAQARQLARECRDSGFRDCD